MTDVHETAVIEEGAELGRDVSIGPYTIISGKTRVGEGTRIGSRVTIEGDVEIGSNNQIKSGTVIGSPPQDVNYGGEETGVRIGSGNVIREYVTVNRATTTPGGVTVIGNDNMLMAYAHVAHDCRLEDGIAMANGVALGGHVTVQEQVMIGGLTPVHQFVRIGAYAMVGGLSRINKDVAPFIRISGNPAKVYDLNSIGLRRHDFSAETRSLLKRAFKMIYRAQNNTSQALEQIEDELPGQESVDRLIEFIRQSERGIHK